MDGLQDRWLTGLWQNENEVKGEKTMALPTGDWQINGNGWPGTLAVSVDGNGNVTGTVYGDPIQGFWGEGAQKLTFLRSPNNDPSSSQIYTGYLFKRGSTDTLAGSFQGFAGTGGAARRAVYGWLAEKLE
jgi:hypothetical protein